MADRKVKYRLPASVSTPTGLAGGRLTLEDKGGACNSAAGSAAITPAMGSLSDNRSDHRRKLLCA